MQISNIVNDFDSKTDDKTLLSKYGSDEKFFNPFIQYLRKNHYTHAFYIKIPKYGNGTLVLNPNNSGKEYHGHLEDVFQVWMTPLSLYSTDQNTNDKKMIQNVQLMKPFEVLKAQGCNRQFFPGCHIHGIPPGKYLVELTIGTLNKEAGQTPFAFFSGY